MKELKTEILIDAPAEKIWTVLIDFATFPDWNPFIQAISGEILVGQRLQVQIVSPEGQVMNFRPTVIQVQPGREFRWLGHLGIPGLFDGEHIFELKSAGENRTKFIHRECFRGLLVPFLWKVLDTQTRQGFELMNQSLKQRVEDHQ